MKVESNSSLQIKKMKVVKSITDRQSNANNNSSKQLYD